MRKGLFLLIIVAAGVVCGCKGERSVELGPAETVEAFCKAVAAGEWEEAETLCCAESMTEYIDGIKQAWGRLEKEDSGAAAIAQSLFAEASISVDGVKKEDDRRVVTYTLEIEGLSKKCKATLRKEEGAWRVEKIQDVN